MIIFVLDVVLKWWKFYFCGKYFVHTTAMMSELLENALGELQTWKSTSQRLESGLGKAGDTWTPESEELICILVLSTMDEYKSIRCIKIRRCDIEGGWGALERMGGIWQRK